MESADFLAEAEVESYNVDETGEGEQSGDDALVDITKLCEVPSVRHHDQVANVDGDVSEEGHQVGPLGASIRPDQARVIASLGPSAISASVDALPHEPEHKEDDKDKGSAKTTALEAQIGVLDREDGRARSHEQTGSE